MSAVGLPEAFLAFAGGSEMDSRAFAKCLKEAGLLGARLTVAEVDLVFLKCRLAGSRRIGLSQFGKALAEVAAKKGMEEASVVERVCAVSRRSSVTTGTVGNVLHNGPTRFFYDKSTYTGTHRHGGPTVLGGGVPKHGYNDLSEVVNRDRVHDNVLQWSKPVLTPRQRQKYSMREQQTKQGENRSEEQPKLQLPVLLGAQTGLKTLDTKCKHHEVSCPPSPPANTPLNLKPAEDVAVPPRFSAPFSSSPVASPPSGFTARPATICGAAPLGPAVPPASVPLPGLLRVRSLEPLGRRIVPVCPGSWSSLVTHQPVHALTSRSLAGKVHPWVLGTASCPAGPCRARPRGPARRQPSGQWLRCSRSVPCMRLRLPHSA